MEGLRLYRVHGREVSGVPLLVVILGAAKNQREAMPSGHQGQYFVYVMSNRTHVLYVGMTNDLMRRVFEHKHKLLSGFTARYSLDRLV